MSLRVKLFLTIGCLFFIFAILSFFLPRIFVQQDAYRFNRFFLEQLEEENEKSRKVWQNVYNERLKVTIDLIDHSLLYIQESPEIQSFAKKALQNIEENSQEIEQFLQLNQALDLIEVVGQGKGFTYVGKSDEKGTFFTKPLVSPEAFAKLNDQGIKPALTDSIYLATLPELNKNYLANIIHIEDGEEYYDIILGKSFFENVTSTLHIYHAAMVLLTPKGEFVKAYDDKSEAIPPSLLVNFPFEKMVGQNIGTLFFENKKFGYFKLTPPMPLPIETFIIIPSSQEPLYNLSQEMNTTFGNMYKVLSYQLFAAAAIILIITLLLVNVVSKRISKPIEILAIATKKVASGQLDNVELPKAKESEQEVFQLSKGFKEMMGSLKEREKLRDVLNKVVSKEIAKEILKGHVQLGGENKEVTIMFADIRGFTAMSEQKEPKMLLVELNNYITMMTEIIEQEGGVIDKYIGDAIMALFGAPVEIENSAQKAINAAIAMIDRLSIWNKERVKKGLEPINIGIGIHTGQVVAGNMGTEKRLNYTVLGAGVNLASRLCSVAGKAEIRVSGPTLDKSGLKNVLEYKDLPKESFKGIKEPLITYQIRGFLSKDSTV